MASAWTVFSAGTARCDGILNGVDYAEWNPEHDPFIARNYSSDDLSGKRECKRALLAELRAAGVTSWIARCSESSRASPHKKAST